MDIGKQYDKGFRYAIQNRRTGKWIITGKELYDACYGKKKKLKPYYSEEELIKQL